MNKASRTGLLATLEYPVKVEVRTPKFRLYSSLKYLDVLRLRKGNHKIEVGIVKGGCCGLRAFAMVKAGMVVGIKFDPCRENKKPLSKNYQTLVRAAYKKVPRPRTWAPISVEDFFRKPISHLSVHIGGGCVEISWGEGVPEDPKVIITCCTPMFGRYGVFVCDVNQMVGWDLI